MNDDPPAAVVQPDDLPSADLARQPASWSDALPQLVELETAGQVVTQVTVPFDGAPDLWVTAGFSAPVVRGESFTARLTNGETIHFT